MVHFWLEIHKSIYIILQLAFEQLEKHYTIELNSSKVTGELEIKMYFTREICPVKIKCKKLFTSFNEFVSCKSE